MSAEIWHNPRCRKSRETLALLLEAGEEPVILEYLKTPPTQKRLKDVAAMLGFVPRDMMRTKETVYRELSLKDASDPALFRAMAENPILIERPIVIKNGKAALGRPPEQVKDIL